MGRVRGDGAGPRIAARLRAKAALNAGYRKRPVKRTEAVTVHVQHAPAPPARIIPVPVDRHGRILRSGWGR